MNKGISVKLIAINAMIAGVYTALTLVLSPISYLGVQARFSEIMVFLAFYNKKFIPGLVIGCFLANIPSPLGAMDMIFGTLSTLIVCIAMLLIKNRYIAALAGGIITGVIIGIELYFAFELPLILTIAQVFAGEFIVLFIGALLFKSFEKNKAVSTLLSI